MARRWLCSWLLFGAAGGLFFGFFWALLTRQKIKKLYLCLPLTPPSLLLPSSLASHHTVSQRDHQSTTQERGSNKTNSSPKPAANVDALMWTQGSCYVVVVVSGSDHRGRTDDGGLSSMSLLSLFCSLFSAATLQHDTTPTVQHNSPSTYRAILDRFVFFPFVCIKLFHLFFPSRNSRLFFSCFVIAGIFRSTLQFHYDMFI